MTGRPCGVHWQRGSPETLARAQGSGVLHESLAATQVCSKSRRRRSSGILSRQSYAGGQCGIYLTNSEGIKGRELTPDFTYRTT
jgi:hypothetical protein